MVSCDNCQRIFQNLASQPLKKGEWHIPILDGKAYQVLKKDTLEESSGHYSISHFQYGPFSEMDTFLLKQIRGLERQVWNMGLLCQVLANAKF
ncbi:MAG: hypothetical protein WCT22_00135 [Patescibacteria group bacterium]|jgi:hypothetical protein